MMFVVSPQKITKGNKVLEMIERWGVLPNMMPGGFKNSLIQQADKLDNFKTRSERVVSIMEAKSALHPDGMDTDNVNYDSYSDTDHDDGEKEDTCAVHKDPLSNRCGSNGDFARNCATLDSKRKVKGQAKRQRRQGWRSTTGQGQFQGSHHLPVLQ